MRSVYVPMSAGPLDEVGVTRTVLVSPGHANASRLMDLAMCATDDAVKLQYIDRAGGVERAPVGEAGVRRLAGAAGRRAHRTGALAREHLAAVRAADAGTIVIGYDPAVDDAAEIAECVRTSTAEGVDVIVVCDRHARPWRRLLVPYTYGAHDPEAFALARRLARRTQGELMLLHVDEPDPHTVATTVRTVDGCTVRVVRGADPVALAEHEAATGYDVLVLGGGSPHPERYFTMRQQCLHDRTSASLVMVHAAAEAAAFDEVWLSGRRHMARPSEKTLR